MANTTTKLSGQTNNDLSSENPFTTGTVTGARDVKRIDIRKHVGKYALIDKVDTLGGAYGPYLRITTQVVEKIDGRDGPIEIRASRLFSLSQDPETKEIYWPRGGNFDTFLNKMKVDHWDKLIGKRVQLVHKPSKNDANKEFLSFD